MKKTVRFVYFDVGGVLMSWQDGHRKVAEEYNVPLEDLQKVFHENWRDACRGTLDLAAYMHKFASVLGMSEPYPDMTDFWTDRFTVISPVHELAHELKEYYKLGILSNAERGILAKAKKKGLIPDIEWHSFIDSSDHGSIKPEKKIYEIAEEMAGVDPGEIFFIDDVAEHITMAESRGWQGVTFDANDIPGSIKKIKKELGLSTKV